MRGNFGLKLQNSLKLPHIQVMLDFIVIQMRTTNCEKENEGDWCLFIWWIQAVAEVIVSLCHAQLGKTLNLQTASLATWPWLFEKWLTLSTG